MTGRTIVLPGADDSSMQLLLINDHDIAACAEGQIRFP
jgi:hypothetical protein